MSMCRMQPPSPTTLRLHSGSAYEKGGTAGRSTSPGAVRLLNLNRPATQHSSTWSVVSGHILDAKQVVNKYIKASYIVYCTSVKFRFDPPLGRRSPSIKQSATCEAVSAVPFSVSKATGNFRRPVSCSIRAPRVAGETLGSARYPGIVGRPITWSSYQVPVDPGMAPGNNDTHLRCDS